MYMCRFIVLFFAILSTTNVFGQQNDKVILTLDNHSVLKEEFVRMYEKNKKKYYWDARFKGWIIKCENQEITDFTENMFDEDPQIEAAELTDQLKEHFGENETEILFGYFEKGTDPMVDYFVWNAEQPADFIDGLHFVRGDKMAPVPKTLEEAKGLYVSDYQNYLEEEWIKELRKKYKIKVNKKVLKSIETVQ